LYCRQACRCRPAGDETLVTVGGRRSFALARRGFIPSAAKGKTDRYRRTAPSVLFFVFRGGVHAYVPVRLLICRCFSPAARLTEFTAKADELSPPCAGAHLGTGRPRRA